MGAEDRVKELGLDLSRAAAPIANYVPAVTTGKLVFLSGKVPTQADGTMLRGKVGADLDVDEALLNELVQGPLEGRSGDSPFLVGLDVRELDLTVVRNDPTLATSLVLGQPSLRHEDQDYKDSSPPQRVEYVRGQ